MIPCTEIEESKLIVVSLRYPHAITIHTIGIFRLLPLPHGECGELHTYITLCATKPYRITKVCIIIHFSARHRQGRYCYAWCRIVQMHLRGLPRKCTTYCARYYLTAIACYHFSKGHSRGRPVVKNCTTSVEHRHRIGIGYPQISV